MIGLPSFAAAVARVAGHPVAAARFQHNSAGIDFRGPPGTIRTVSFSDVYYGRVPASVFAGRVVVVGATSATLQDLHATSTTSSKPMSGAEVQANAIWTALHGNPLGPAGPGWDVVAIVLGALCAPLLSLRLALWRSSPIAIAIAVGYLLTAQVMFDHGRSCSFPIRWPRGCSPSREPSWLISWLPCRSGGGLPHSCATRSSS